MKSFFTLIKCLQLLSFTKHRWTVMLKFIAGEGRFAEGVSVREAISSSVAASGLETSIPLSLSQCMHIGANVHMCVCVCVCARINAYTLFSLHRKCIFLREFIHKN